MKVRVKEGNQVKHDETLYKPGEVIDVTTEQAKELGEAGAIDLEPVVETTQRKAEPRPTST